METERLLIDTAMPAGEVRWLADVGIMSMHQLARLSHEEIESLRGFRGDYLLAILLVGIDEDIPMMSLSLEQMAQCAADIVGHPVTARETLLRLASFQERCIIFGYGDSLVA